MPGGLAAAAPPYGNSLTYGNVTISGAAGDRVDAVFTVRNDGDSPVYGASIDLALGESRLTPLFDAANCYHPEAARLACDFAGTFAPHTAYRLVLPYRVVDRYPHQIIPGVYSWDALPEHPAGGGGTDLVLDPPLGALLSRRAADPERHDVLGPHGHHRRCCPGCRGDLGVRGDGGEGRHRPAGVHRAQRWRDEHQSPAAMARDGSRPASRGSRCCASPFRPVLRSSPPRTAASRRPTTRRCTTAAAPGRFPRPAPSRFRSSCASTTTWRTRR
nr:hypothetical protein GCM10020092_096550 [Actinoplanes digitatis]